MDTLDCFCSRAYTASFFISCLLGVAAWLWNVADLGTLQGFDEAGAVVAFGFAVQLVISIVRQDFVSSYIYSSSH